MGQDKKPSLLLISVGSILSSMAIAGFLLGFLADFLFETTPLFLLLFGLLGLIGGTIKVYRFLTHPDLN
ncbi:MAG: AtpZ/AtpI family protein [Gammaproteobacteria bacterium]|nr:AtpZ/AtpI family protein [Gammaproteobacteria bacterium]